MFRPDKKSEWEIAERGLSPQRLYWKIARHWAGFHSESTLNSKEHHSSETKNEKEKENTDRDTVKDNGWETVQFRVRAANTQGYGLKKLYIICCLDLELMDLLLLMRMILKMKRRKLPRRKKNLDYCVFGFMYCV